MSNDLLSTFEALHPQVLILHVRWAQFTTLFTVSDSRMALLTRTAPGFFRIIKDLLLEDAFISLSRLTVPSTTGKEKNLSLVTLVEKAEAIGPNNLALNARSILNQLLDRVRPVRKWRKKWLAHTDLVIALENNIPLLDAPVKRGDIDIALNLIRQLMELFANHFSQQPMNYQNVYFKGNAEDLVQLLEEHR